MSIVSNDVTSLATGPLLPDTSVTEFAASCKAKVPSVHRSTETLTVDPLDEAGVNVHPVADPPLLEKCPDVSPYTGSLNVTVNVAGKERIGDDGAVIDTVGAVVSINSAVMKDVGPVLPAASVNTAVTSHNPSVRPEISHDPLDDATVDEQVRVEPFSVAVKTMEPDDSGVVAETVTVVKFVFESVALTPTSVLAASRGAAAALGAVRSIVRVELVAADTGPEFPARSATIDAFNVRVTVPPEQLVTATEIVIPVGAAGTTVHVVAVPATVKSPAVSPVISSLKVRANVGEDAFVGVTSGANRDTVGEATSRVTVEAVVRVAGPRFERASSTVFSFNARITVPAEQLVTVTVTVVPDAALIDVEQPVAVPVTWKSLDARDVMDSLKVTV